MTSFASTSLSSSAPTPSNDSPTLPARTRLRSGNSKGVGATRPVVRGSSNSPSFKPPVLSLRNAVLFSDVYARLVGDSASTVTSPTEAEGRQFEATVAELLDPAAPSDVLSHFCTCSRRGCERNCVDRRHDILTVAIRWYKYFNQLEAERKTLSPLDFHHKALVDHVLVTVLVEKGGDKLKDQLEATLVSAPKSASTVSVSNTSTTATPSASVGDESGSTVSSSTTNTSTTSLTATPTPPATARSNSSGGGGSTTITNYVTGSPMQPRRTVSASAALLSKMADW